MIFVTVVGRDGVVDLVEAFVADADDERDAARRRRG